MSYTAHDPGLADFTAQWRKNTTTEQVTAGFAVIGLTNFGERPVPVSRLAEVLGRPVSAAEVAGWPGTRVEDGLITVNPERAKPAPRRQLQIGDRRFGVTGCAPDIFLYAPLVRPSLQVEETCPATGTPIRIAFTPDHVESVDPSGAVVALPHPTALAVAAGPSYVRVNDVNVCLDAEETDATVCAQWPLFSSAEAAEGLVAAHPDARVFPVREAWDLSFLREWRDRMPALLNLGN